MSVQAVLVLAALAALAAARAGVLSRRQLECLAARKVLHSGGCHTLLEQGPCDPGSRLVLDEAVLPGVAAACRPCKCCDLPRAVWWPAEAACRRARDEEELCGGPTTGTYLGEDLFGDGACLCRPGHARSRGQSSGACHALYHRGPCPRGQVFILVKAEDDEPRCADDPCARENSRAGNATYAMAPDGRCYTLGSRGPCPDDSSFNVHPAHLRPSCIFRTYHIIQLPCRSDVQGVSGEGCKEEVSPQDDTSFGQALVRAAKNKQSAGKT